MALRQQQRVKDASSEGGMDSVQRSSTGSIDNTVTAADAPGT